MTSWDNHIMQQIAPVGHTTSIAAFIAAILNWLPPVLASIGAIFGIVWYTIVIYESRTFQHWKRNRQMKKRAKKLAKLRAKERIVLAEIDAIEKVRSARVEAREIVEHAKVDA